MKKETRGIRYAGDPHRRRCTTAARFANGKALQAPCLSMPVFPEAGNEKFCTSKILPYCEEGTPAAGAAASAAGRPALPAGKKNAEKKISL